MMDFLHALRHEEAKVVLNRLAPGMSLLEIGGGAGWQARAFADHGLLVTSIDIDSSHYLQHAVFPVVTYDGHHIPAEDGKFQLVFSSNVLEHIPHLTEFLGETRRVLAVNGQSIHILPSASWRFWTLLTESLVVWKNACEAFFKGISKLESRAGDGIARRWARGCVRCVLHVYQNFPPKRHGEFGNALTELWLFSRFRWRRVFQQSEFEVADEVPMGLFYTGCSLLGSWLPISWRKRLAPILGSSCRLYVLRNRSSLSSESVLSSLETTTSRDC